MTAPDRRRTRWIAFPLVLAGVLVACDDATPTAEALCARAAACEDMDLLVSNDACVQQIKKRLIETSPDCSTCVLSIPCSGMARVASGQVTLGQICPSCPSFVSRNTCPPGHQHLLICGLATRPVASASASASASATPPSSSAPRASAAPSASAAPKAAPSSQPAAHP